jgi:hypothetical protein
LAALLRAPAPGVKDNADNFVLGHGQFMKAPANKTDWSGGVVEWLNRRFAVA